MWGLLQKHSALIWNFLFERLPTSHLIFETSDCVTMACDDIFSPSLFFSAFLVKFYKELQTNFREIAEVVFV